MNEMNDNSASGNEEMEARLWEYIDGLTDAGEKTVIDRLIQSNAEWKEKYGELLDIHQLMQSSELDEPSMRFTKNVMDEIGKLHIAPATKTYINKNVIRGIGLFFVLLITGFIVYGFAQLDWSGSNDSSSMPVDFNKVNFNKFDLGKIFNNTWINIFMMVNVVIGLFFIDRYLANKRVKRESST
ncbi:MAG TPA: hypothetical protein VK644_14245 [Chitinophagaceae bacterium]|nr:hypothetical protein [Chitinophagaceae bacterium]